MVSNVTNSVSTYSSYTTSEPGPKPGGRDLSSYQLHMLHGAITEEKKVKRDAALVAYQASQNESTKAAYMAAEDDLKNWRDASDKALDANQKMFENSMRGR